MKYAFENILDSIVGRGWYVPSYNRLDECISRSTYPVDLDFTLNDKNRYYRPFDDVGIPMRKYKSVGIKYNPTRVAAYGLASWNRYLRNNSIVDSNAFLACADWFMSEPSAVWSYDFDWGRLEAPWHSCMAQGEGISVLVRAFRHTGESRYLDHAVLAADPFRVSVQDGGVLSRLPDGSPFLEEYPDAAQQSHTLNGFLYALIGLGDLEAVDHGTAESAGLYDLLNSLSCNIELWDVDRWSMYDLEYLRGGGYNFCTLKYHTLQCTQLGYLAGRHDMPKLGTVSERWRSVATSPLHRLRALYAKVKYRLDNPPQR